MDRHASIRRFIAAACLWAVAMTASAGPAEPNRFGIGDTPPPLVPMEWIKGPPLGGFRPGHVYVVNFFATWCGASRQSLPLMSRIAQAHAGDLTVIGVNVREDERGEATAEAVSRFVSERPDSFTHPVAMDDPEATPLFRSWMRGAQMYGTPTAFVIDREGRVAWIGIPIDDRNTYPLERAVADAIAGTVDVDAARMVHADTARQIAEYLRDREVLAEANAARTRGDHIGTLAALDAIVEAHPEYQRRTQYMRLNALLHLDEEQALAFAGQALATVDDDTAQRDRIAGSLGRTIADHDHLSAAAQARALGYLRQALSSEPRGYGAVLNWLSIAALEQRRGRIEDAVSAQEHAVAMADDTPEVSPDMLAWMTQTLAEYRDADADRP